MHVTLKAGVNELESLFAIGFLKRAPQRAECGRLGYNFIAPTFRTSGNIVFQYGGSSDG